MPFHVEIRQGFQHARVFNLDEGRLRREVVDHWLSGRAIRLGDRDWQPRDCELRILDGPELQQADLAMGRGWSNAEKASEDVTRALVSAAATEAAVPIVSVLADGEPGEEELRGVLGRLELQSVPWGELRGRILASGLTGEESGYAAILVAGSTDPSPAWLFDAGLARGALGRRAILVQLGDAGIPAQLAGIEAMRLVPGDEGSLRALWEKLTG